MFVFRIIVKCVLLICCSIVDEDKFCRCILCIVLDKCIFCGVVKYVFGYNIILKDVDSFLVVFGV